MKQCKKISELLHLFAADELDINLHDEVNKHLLDCSECNEKFNQIKLISSSLKELKNEAEMVFDDIIWEYESKKLINSINNEKNNQTKFFWRFSTGFAYSLILFFSISLVYFIPDTNDLINDKTIVLQHDTVSKMEDQLDRGDIIKSLNKGSMLIGDFMKQCNSSTDINYIFREQQVKKLLKQNRYIMGNIKSKRLVSAKKMLGQINYLLYEMTSLHKEGSCSDVKPIQDFVKERQLLLKIKLIKDELKYKEIS